MNSDFTLIFHVALIFYTNHNTAAVKHYSKTAW